MVHTLFGNGIEPRSGKPVVTSATAITAIQAQAGKKG